MAKIISLLSLIALASIVLAAPSNASGKRTLVLLDDATIKSTHSQYFQSLSDRGHDLKFADSAGAELSLSEYGEFVYDNLILFCPSTPEFGGMVDVQTLLEFVDSGRHVLVAASENVSDPVVEFAAECGIDIHRDASAVDHFNSASDSDHSIFEASNFVSEAIASKSIKSVLYHGTGMTVDRFNPLAFEILAGSDTTYSAPRQHFESYPESAGAETALTAALQARNNARVTVVGSIDLFSDEYLSNKKYGNAAFATEVTRWTFAEKGLLRASNIRHHGPDGETHDTYTVKDKITYSIDIEEFDGTKWSPYKADDVQMEFVMLDPKWRLNLKHNGQGTYSVEFEAPDVYGIYQFRVNYNKQGVSSLNFQTQVAIRPYRHNQFERFIPMANPYYFSVFSMMGGFFLFGIVFLHSKTADKDKTE